MRSATWLEAQLQDFLKGSFADLEVCNRLEIHWGRAAQRRFGSIKMSRDQRVSTITINGLFRDESIPEQIIQATLAHELAHYAHGFSSPLPRKYKSPHAGGVIDRELRKRGLGLLSAYEKQWTKNHWPEVLKQNFGRRQRVLVPRRKSSVSPALKLLFNLFN